MEGFLRFIGRLCFAALFIFSGIGKLTHFDATIAQMTSEGIPYANTLAIAAIVVELGAGLMIILGWQIKLAAAIIILFTIPVTYYFHDFWTFEGTEAQNQLIHFMKNLAIIGGACFIATSSRSSCGIDHNPKDPKATA